MSDVTITGLNLVKAPRPWATGDMLIAHFDCEVRGFAFFGCLLIKTAKNGFVVRLPKVEDHRGKARVVEIREVILTHQIMDAARRAFVAFGGQGGEWTPFQGNE